MMLLRFAIPTALVRNLLRRGDGTAALEFALCAPLLLTCMLGVIEFGRVMWTQNALHYAVADAARCMTFDATDCGSAGTTESYAARISGLTFANATTVFTATSGASCGSSITGNQVTASYRFPFLTSLVSFNVTLTADACYPT